jgi:hypothetical protein
MTQHKKTINGRRYSIDLVLHLVRIGYGGESKGLRYMQLRCLWMPERKEVGLTERTWSAIVTMPREENHN